MVGHDHLVGRMAIPYIAASGQVVDIRFRAIGPQEPKYLGLPAAETKLYNVSDLFKSDGTFVAVCEGEMDTITLSGCGIPTVGVPGVNNWKKHFSRILEDYETVFVFADGDQPGADFAKHVAKEIETVRIIQMPDGEDVNSFYVKYGREALLDKAGLKDD